MSEASPAGGGQRRFLFILAGGCIAGGVVLISLAAYNLLQSGSAQQWVYVRPIAETSPSAVAGAVSAPAPPLGDQPYRLVIERLGVDAPVATYGLDENALPEVPYEPYLVAWYNFSVPPGTGGNAVFAGHYTWNGDAVFRHLDQLQAGDEIVLRSADGSELVYEVSENELVDPALEGARRWMGSTETDVITLVTCGGNYRKTDDPVFGGEYDRRQVIRAALVGQSAAAPAGGGTNGS